MFTAQSQVQTHVFRGVKISTSTVGGWVEKRLLLGMLTAAVESAQRTVKSRDFVTFWKGYVTKFAIPRVLTVKGVRLYSSCHRPQAWLA